MLRRVNAPMPMRSVETNEFTLEPQAAVHAPEMFTLLCDPAIYQYENEPPASLEWLRERFARLEARQSADGREQWLNWVVRLPTGELIGYVQATVQSGGRAAIAYVLGSAYWGRGLASRAVRVMMSELAARYEVHALAAVLKRDNRRSLRLLERLGFSLASREEHVARQVDTGEILMLLQYSPDSRSAYAPDA